MFFDSWQALARVLVAGVLSYAALVLLLRLSGNRTLTKLNAFDLVITVALGSTLATTLLSKDVYLLEGVLAFSVLIGLQYLVTWSSMRWPLVDRTVKSAPVLLVYRGRMLSDAMRRARVADVEILAVLRHEGITAVDDALAVVLESDGSLSAIRQETPPRREVPVLVNMDRPDQE